MEVNSVLSTHASDQMAEYKHRFMFLQANHEQYDENEPNSGEDHRSALAEAKIESLSIFSFILQLHSRAKEVHSIAQCASLRLHLFFILVGDAEEVQRAHNPNVTDENHMHDGNAPCHCLHVHLVATSVIVVRHGRCTLPEKATFQSSK